LSKILNFGKIAKILDDILNYRRSPFLKSGHGYNEKQKTPKGYERTKVTKKSEKEMKKILKFIFSKAPSIMKASTRKEMMTIRNLILLTRTTRMSSKELSHQEGVSQLDKRYVYCLFFFLQ
jgi:hypothetical protein